MYVKTNSFLRQVLWLSSLQRYQDLAQRTKCKPIFVNWEKQSWLLEVVAALRNFAICGTRWHQITQTQKQLLEEQSTSFTFTLTVIFTFIMIGDETLLFVGPGDTI